MNSIKQRWEKDRAHIGSQWAWLCHQITSINQKIFQHDTLLQSAPPKESVQLVPHNPFSSPCICGSQQNGETKTNSSPTKIGTNGQYPPGGGQGVQPEKPVPPLPPPSRPCACQIKQMILSNPTLMTQHMQVKDILGYSLPALLMEESSQTCARTRMLRHAPKRKLLRAKKKGRQSEGAESSDWVIDSAYHPFLSQPTGQLIVQLAFDFYCVCVCVRYCSTDMFTNIECKTFTLLQLAMQVFKYVCHLRVQCCAYRVFNNNFSPPEF